MERPRTLFFGTPAFAVPCLRAVHAVSDVVQVFSQPDRPSGRGMRETPPPVKVTALELGLEVSQPTRIKTASFAESLRAFHADVAVVVAYGRILPKAVLEASRRGSVNVHASLLPRWRGAAPIQWSILAGDHETGVCLMQMDEGLDTGPVLARKVTPIDENETSPVLAERLSDLGAELLSESLLAHVRGDLTPEPQPEVGMTYASMLEKSHGDLRWNASARTVHDQVRGLVPWPGAFTHHGSTRIKVHASRIVAHSGSDAAPGTVLRADRHGLEVQCGEGVVSLLELQLDGRKRLPVEGFLAGYALEPGARFEHNGGANA
ncbi:MAG: methionyl-tRNA formyltransferase [Polyangiales bacterium]